MVKEIELFPERKDQSRPSFPIGIVVNRMGKQGQVGIEIEVEGKRLPMPDTTPLPWYYKHDGSLRGEENAEYILSEPIPFSEVPEALAKLWKVFKSKKSRLDDSNRTSVHVHLNCQTFHMNRLTALIALYFIAEEILTQYCGEYRIGNMFCLRAKDATAIVSHIRGFIRTDGQYRLNDGLHYSGLNTQALQKFGSLEIRTLRGCSDPKIIEEWVSILECLYNKSAEFKDPRDVCGLFSCNGPIAFFYEIFGDSALILKSSTGWSDEKISESLLEGIRHAQDLCYCRDWAEYREYDLKPDPFCRDMRVIMNKIIKESGGEPQPQLDYAQGGLADYLTVQPSPTWAEPDYPPEPDYDEEDNFGLDEEGIPE